jgi:hypothetical protein
MSYVGYEKASPVGFGISASALAAKGINTSDQVIKDLDVPVVAQALELLDEVYAIADDLGIGPEVRAAVTTARTASYASTILTNYLPSVASNAVGGALIAGLGAVAIVATVAVIVVAIVGLFSDDDEEKHLRVKQAQARILHLRERLTLNQFADEQTSTAGLEIIYAKAPGWLGPLSSFAISPEEHLKQAVQANKFASFYRTAAKRLNPDQRALFESVSNLARWQSSLNTYAKMTWPERDAVDAMFGKSAPRLPWQLQAPMAQETKNLAAIVARIQAKGPAIGTGLMATIAQMMKPKKTTAVITKPAQMSPVVAVGLGMGLAAVAAGGALWYLSKKKRTR